MLPQLGPENYPNVAAESRGDFFFAQFFPSPPFATPSTKSPEYRCRTAMTTSIATIQIHSIFEPDLRRDPIPYFPLTRSCRLGGRERQVTAHDQIDIVSGDFSRLTSNGEPHHDEVVRLFDLAVACHDSVF